MPTHLALYKAKGKLWQGAEKGGTKQQNDVLVLAFLVIAGIMFSYIKKWKAEEWKAILTFIVPILIIVVVAYIWYRHQRITGKTPEHFSHVFLSCKSDILQTHANPLNMALKNIQLRTFYYVERENLGCCINEKLQVGVKHSASAIIIFSKEFARSNWCLYELVLILERNRTSVYPIIPIYYDEVNYWDLTFEKESIYQEALENLRVIYGEKKVNEWKEALKDVGCREARRATGYVKQFPPLFF